MPMLLDNPEYRRSLNKKGDPHAGRQEQLDRLIPRQGGSDCIQRGIERMGQGRSEAKASTC